ncbi:MAG: hypothetical protein J4478_00360 [Candidatus Diapherotrites archaeon]|uniref:Transcription regulator TrmB N-terminal domain-containing protein n=1 Tax=Candidatus Iainarchaeum sp. TaxID=3101447 RepID=A0A8T4L487_9ARCH|nr:hypothetical protein [Candidatus Diapherotrites archaeon]
MEKGVLTELGFSEGEAEIYLALLKNGPSTVMQLAKKTGRHRTHIYDTLEKLLEKACVSFIAEGKMRKFQAANPENLLLFLKEKEEKTLALLPELKKAYEEQKSDFEINVFKGKNGLKSIYEDVLREKKTRYIISKGGAFKEFMPEYYEKWVSKVKKLRMKSKIITRQGYAEKQRKGLEQRHFSEKFITPHSTMIYGDKVALLLWSVPLGILIKNKKISQDYKKYFDFLWGIAKT